MKKLLVTGGTVFVSKYVANYFKDTYEVYVLNRNTRTQLDEAYVIEADRNYLGDKLKQFNFDAVIDVCAYNGQDVKNLLDALNPVKKYVLISSSAVYPETNEQPFNEKQQTGINSIWGQYGIGKIEAEKNLLTQMPSAYVLRLPYLYGPMNNVYREAFVFECALANRKFYLPQDGKMKLQFCYVNDLCRFINILLQNEPKEHIFNVGNKEVISIREWVELCYEIAGKKAVFVSVSDDIEQRNYFSFYNYEYYLDVTKQHELISNMESLQDGLKECFNWYKNYSDEVNKKPYIEYINNNLSMADSVSNTVC